MAAEPAERRKLLDVLQETPARLSEILDGLPHELVRWTPAPGKWSILQIVCHLRDMERDAYLARYRRLLAEENPTLPDIDSDALALESDYQSQDLAEAFEEWKRLRSETLALLDGASRLTEAQWARGGVHEGLGPLTMEGYLKRQAIGNDLAHFGQIRDIRSRYLLLERLAAAPKRLGELAQGLADEAIRRKSPKGGWSIVENACHLRDVELLFADRFTKAAHQEKPRFWMMDNDRVAALKRYCAADLARVIAEFTRLRSDTLSLLRALPPTVWRRVGVHPKRGELTIEELAEVLAGHDESHLDRVAALADAGRAAAAKTASTER
jgi:hypothetical protein